MRLFNCHDCQQVLFFENSSCLVCGHTLGYAPIDNELYSLNDNADGTVSPMREPRWRFRYCANRQRLGCNWLLASQDEGDLCLSCSYTEVAPPLDQENHITYWRRLEIAKRRLLYSLMRLHQVPPTKVEDPAKGLAFAFKAVSIPEPPRRRWWQWKAPPAPPVERVMTGHASGLITINVAEADPAFREDVRESMSERYRTLLGHFRHEVGHYIWDRLAEVPEFLDAFRERFGDERDNYSAALQRHYRDGAPANWHETFISTYASTHPWEDWAETFAHYLHIVDTLETAHNYGLSVNPQRASGDLAAIITANPYESADFRDVLEDWVPVSFALNSLNRSMGLADAYPFVVPEPVVSKLLFVQRWIRTVGEPST